LWQPAVASAAVTGGRCEARLEAHVVTIVKPDAATKTGLILGSTLC